MTRVLLFSPVAERDPSSGDTSYTEALLAQPPPGVEYTTYAEALEDGSLRIRGSRASLRSKPRFRPVDAAVLASRALEEPLRRVGVMYREPTWFVTIEPGAFDLVHQHLFSVRQIGDRLPVVSTGGYPLEVLYGAREGWGARRLQLANGLQRLHDRLVGAHDPLLRGRPGSHMAAYSEQGRSLLAARSPGAHTSVVGTGAPDLHIPPKRSDGRTIGLIARDFELKGADVALDAFALLRARTPAARLLVITRTADTARPELQQPGVEVRTERPRAEVLASWWPRVDILLAPTRADCGAPYSFLEALQSGTPVVASTLPWLDDRLVPPAAFRLPLDPATIAAELDRLLEPAALAEARAAATELWAESFSMDALGAELEALYRRASGAGRTASADEQPSTG